jgi:hypothetical protein
MGGVIAELELQGLPQAGFRLIAAALHQAHMAEVVVGQRQLGPAPGQIHGHIGILRREAPRLIERLQGQPIALLLQRRDPQPKPALHHAGLGAHQLPKSLGGLRPLPTLQGPLPRLEQGFAAAGAAQ